MGHTMTGNQADLIIAELITTNGNLANVRVELSDVKAGLASIPDKTEKIAKKAAKKEIDEHLKNCPNNKRNSTAPKPITKVFSVDDKTRKWITITLVGAGMFAGGANMETILKIFGIGG